MAPSRRKSSKAAAASTAARREWKVGDLVLAKVKGFQAWPAMVSEPEKWGFVADWKKVLVCFFGTQQIAFCNPVDVEAFTEEKKQCLLRKRHGKYSDFGRSLTEIIDTFEKLKKEEEVNNSGDTDDEDPVVTENNNTVEALTESVSSVKSPMGKTVSSGTQIDVNVRSGYDADDANSNEGLSEREVTERSFITTYSTRRRSERTQASKSCVLRRRPTVDKFSSGILQDISARRGKRKRKKPCIDDYEVDSPDVVSNCSSSAEVNDSGILTVNSEGSDVEWDSKSVKDVDQPIDNGFCQRLDIQTNTIIHKKKRKPKRKRHINENLEYTYKLDEKKVLDAILPSDHERSPERSVKEDGDAHLPLLKRARVRMSRSLFTSAEPNSSQGSEEKLQEESLSLSEVKTTFACGPSLDVEAALPPSKRLHRALEAMSANAAQDDKIFVAGSVEETNQIILDSPKDKYHSLNSSFKEIKDFIDVECSKSLSPNVFKQVNSITCGSGSPCMAMSCDDGCNSTTSTLLESFAKVDLERCQVAFDVISGTDARVQSPYIDTSLLVGTTYENFRNTKLCDMALENCKDPVEMKCEDNVVESEPTERRSEPSSSPAPQIELNGENRSLAGDIDVHLARPTSLSDDHSLEKAVNDGLDSISHATPRTLEGNTSASDIVSVRLNGSCSPGFECFPFVKGANDWNCKDAQVNLSSFEAILGTLTRTKESIGRATRLAIDCAKDGVASKVVEVIARNLEREPSLHRRVDLFFLVDSIAQFSSGLKGDNADIYPAILSVLPRLLSAAAPPGITSQENRRQCLKVLKVWLERKILPESTIRHHIRELDSFCSSSCARASRRAFRNERAFDDPIREMEGMLVDEYGSNSSFELGGFRMPPMVRDEDDGESFEAVTPEHNAENIVVEKHTHILEDIDGELEMEDVAPTESVAIENSIPEDVRPASPPPPPLHPHSKAVNKNGFRLPPPPHPAPSNHFSYVQNQRVKSRRDTPPFISNRFRMPNTGNGNGNFHRNHERMKFAPRGYQERWRAPHHFPGPNYLEGSRRPYTPAPFFAAQHCDPNHRWGSVPSRPASHQGFMHHRPSSAGASFWRPR